MARRMLAALLWCLPVAVCAEGAQSTVTVYHPGMPWVLRYELAGVLEEYNNHKPGVSTYAVAASEARRLRVSVQIHAAGTARSAIECRDQEYARLKQNPKFGNPEVRFTQDAGADMEVLIPVAGGVSRHLHRYWLRDGQCAKVHASRTPFRDEDAAAFATLLQSVRFDAATPTLERAFVIPGRGTLLINVPAAWGFRTTQPAAELPRDIAVFMDPAGERQLMLTLFPDPGQLMQGDATPRTFVENARQYAIEKAVERDPPMRELAGGGFYFMVTDKDLVDKPPQPNDWRYLWQGARLAGEALVLFSVFSNTKDDPAVEGALASIGAARVLK